MIYFSSGDAPFYFKEQMESLSWLPQVWESHQGFGVNLLPRLWIDYPFRFFIKLLSSFGLEWGIIEKFLWAGVLLIGIVSMYRLSRYILGKQYSYVSILIYLTNTYALFLFGGGQLGVALAYSLSPLVLLRFIQFIDRTITDREVTSTKWQVPSICNGLWLSLLVCFDLRIAYLVMGAVVLYLVLSIKYQVQSTKYGSKMLNVFSVICYLLSAICVAAIPHLFWILPMIAAGGGISGLGEELTNANMLRFLSFADFSHALSLLHPNWPENLFGKVYFLQPEFLLLPILAFGVLMWTHDHDLRSKTEDPGSKNYDPILNTKYPILFFALLSLIGVFFSKGANPPFGELYIWLFDHIPGFVMFRDPTKFYVFTAIGYSILIPFTLKKISENIEQRTDNK